MRNRGSYCDGLKYVWRRQIFSSCRTITFFARKTKDKSLVMPPKITISVASFHGPYPVARVQLRVHVYIISRSPSRQNSMHMHRRARATEKAWERGYNQVTSQTLESYPLLWSHTFLCHILDKDTADVETGERQNPTKAVRDVSKHKLWKCLVCNKHQLQPGPFLKA